jgi:hypothetical protein
MIIDSKITLGPKLKVFDQETIKNEIMFFNCTWGFAYENGGEPTKDFLLSLPSHLHNDKTIIDSRVHMLMPGWFPCIPGYHHDDVPRERYDKQPEYYNPSYRSQHALVLYNGDICPTEFAIGEQVFSNPEDHKIIYREWHKEVEQLINQKQLNVIKAPSEQIVYFDDRTWHQGTKAVGSGWRLFIRASWNTERKPTNEIRRQVQTYMPFPMEGW